MADSKSKQSSKSRTDTKPRASARKGSGRGLTYWLALAFIIVVALYPVLSSSLGGSSADTGSQAESTEVQAPSDSSDEGAKDASGTSGSGVSLDQIPSYTGSAYTVLGERPAFTEEELSRKSFIDLSDLDDLGRCGAAFALIGPETMPSKDEERGSIREIHPSGWRSVRFESLISDEDSDGHVYERSHLLGWALTGLNAEARNLITGTHYFNDESMRPFEVQVARYVEKTDGHVLYRVTPVFAGSNLVAQGVRMEALSVEDDGKSVCFDVFVYNVQPGFSIDYSDGYVTEDTAAAAN